MPTVDKHVIERASAAGHGRHRDFRDLAAAKPKERVGVPLAPRRTLLNAEHVFAILDRPAVHGKEHIALAHACAAGGRIRGDLGGDDRRAPLDP